MTDQQRFDTLGKWVGSVEITPSWNRLEKEGASFRRAYDACPLCVPARTSLATGKNPLASGMLLNDLAGVHARDNTTIHELLASSGYEVAHVGVNHISVKPSLAEKVPFSLFYTDDDYARDAKDAGLDISRRDYQRDMVMENADGKYIPRPYSNTKVAPWPYETRHFKDVVFGRKACEFLRGKHERPFALFVCLWAPHPPLTVPKEYFDLFPPDAFTLAPTVGRVNDDEPHCYVSSASRQLGLNPPQKGWKEGMAAHAALTRLADDQLGLILSALGQSDYRDNTLIVATTDHGEQMGEHDMYQKMEMYESATHVPAIFKLPGATPRSSDVPISHLDFVPTIIDLLDLDVDKDTFEGQSLAPFITHGTAVCQKDVFSLYNGNHAYGDVRRMIVRGNLKLIYAGGEWELFDLSADPFESHNVFADPAYGTEGESMRKALLAWSKQNHDSYTDYKEGKE